MNIVTRSAFFIIAMFTLQNTYSQDHLPVLNLTISTEKPVSIIFASEVDSIIYSSENITAKLSESSTMTVKVSVNIADFNATGLEIFTADGQKNIFIITYASDPRNSNVVPLAGSNSFTRRDFSKTRFKASNQSLSNR